MDDTALSLLRSLADAVIVADADGMITEWNTGAEALFGWPSSEAIGASLDLIIPERLRRRHWDGYSKVMKTGHTVHAGELLEVPALHRSGDVISVWS